MVGAMPVNLIPKFCNGTMDSRNGTEEGESQVRIGSRVKCNDDFATVKYIGEVQGYKGIWYGVEWDDPARGKHDGSVDDIQYFKTSKPGAGSFIRPNKIAPTITCADAIKKYYGDREDETVAAHRRTVINEWKREMGAPFIEMVGFEKIHQKQKFDRLVEVCVRDRSVSRAGDVAALCPNTRSLDVSRNLFSNWREVIQLSAQLPDLRELDVSKNRMAIDLPEETLDQLSIHLSNLEKLNLSVCDYDWSDILALSHLTPKIHEIIAAYNRVKTISPPTVTLRTLTILKLDGNPIDSWYEVMNLGWLKNLKVLSLNDCQIEEIRFNDNPGNAKVDVFENLEVLFLNRNKINDWRSVSELDKLNHLRKLYFLKNPIQAIEDYDTGSQLIMAKIGILQELNGSQITRELRRGAEYDYMKRYGAEWKRAQTDLTLRTAFDIDHCRFQELVMKYGIPDDSLLVQQPKTSTLTSQLLEITLEDENGKRLKKKFPNTMAVQKLVTLAQRLFAKGNTGRPKLYLLDDQMKGAEICLDNCMKDLAYYSVKNGDNIMVKFR
ncbi:tubulin-specific chaperone E [Leguminivora glycinivorella]|uniref:tubulin-specific chaperone E n=1 Tax=Leguminivora glycinivorella TaxID=1035111 RepID=UPI00200DC582|nr:tubulin-specific chaperone E [Leguminivora glycinivorella]